MKKVLIISYYWPPGSGAGVLRWLKFSKYLRNHGWEPVVYTAKNPEAQGTDHTLTADIPWGMTVIRRTAIEPYGLYKLLTGRKQNEKIQAGFLRTHRKPGIFEKLSTWIRGNLFIPDARKFWIRPSARFLLKWLKKNPVDAIISTGPPHSMHLIALRIKEKTGIPWMADFRDPWTQIDYYDKLMLTKRADALHKKLEQKVLMKADKLVTVSHHCAEYLKIPERQEIHVVTNGFDLNDFQDLPSFDAREFSITHLGSMNADRNPKLLWKVLSELVLSDPFFSEYLHIRFIGHVDYSVKESLQNHSISAFAAYNYPMPYRQALANAANSAILLLPLNNTSNVMGITTGKLFDYIGLKRPILCIGPPEGDAAAIIRGTRSGKTVGFDDEEKCRETLLQWAASFRKGQLRPRRQSAKDYTREELAAQIALLLDEMSE